MSCDYAYLTKNGIFAREELAAEEREGASRILVMYCSATHTPFADGVPRKGADAEGYVVECLKRNVFWLGHFTVTIRSDNEPALVQVVERAIAALKMSGVENVVEEGSVPYDPQTNGAAENAVKLLKGTLRANQLSLERMIQARIPLDHPIIAWLVLYSARVRTLRSRGADGKTAHERARGSAASIRLISFGETCRYKCRAQEKGIGDSTQRWSSGVWLGVDPRTGQHIMFDEDFGGIRMARSLLRMPQPQKWSLEAIRAVSATPWSEHEAREPGVIQHDPAIEPAVRPEEKIVQTRRVYIRQADLVKPQMSSHHDPRRQHGHHAPL